MPQSPFGRDRVEALLDLVGPADHGRPVHPADLFLDDGRRGEHAGARFAERFQ
jgi:hypothetical protein